MTDVIYIDGSQGEGGGQIVRSSLALSLVTERTVTIDRIRAGREKPGLMRQHLTAVNAAVEICGGKATGAAIGSRAITFEPQPVRAGEYRFSVGTAGSTTLVLQAVLPALLTSDGPTTLILEGGTHNAWAPPFDFLERVLLPLINRMGPRVEVDLERHGFYPAGGGRFRVHIQPAPTLSGFDLCERGDIVDRRARVLLANLPAHIARREIDTVIEKTGWNANCCSIVEVESAGPGNVVLLELASSHVTEVFTGFGQQGVKAERVAGEAAKQVCEYLQAGVPVGPYLADQLLLPLGISAWQREESLPGGASASLPLPVGEGRREGHALDSRLQATRRETSPAEAGTPTPSPSLRQRGGSFRTLPLSCHATTHIDLLRQFLGISIDVEQSPTDSCCTVHIAPSGV